MLVAFFVNLNKCILSEPHRESLCEKEFSAELGKGRDDYSNKDCQETEVKQHRSPEAKAPPPF